MDHQELRSVYSVLQLIYHRNKNQHIRAKWWKWLAVLKRSASDLPSMKCAAAHAHRQHLINYVIPKCYMAFSSVVADNQFATLGVALLATLARLAKAIGFNQELKAQTRHESRTFATKPCIEDRGERVQRINANAGTSSTARQAKGPTPSTAKTRSKKKSSKHKSTKNAIDDLFSGLL
ncbi:hypothetical protein N7468_001920 [Penicillium chermesinum]|uniref:RNase MRP protein 1 RNA binding domain-containing protein n=1 Tax=Penicillium chermesinum TaxID=63820 RepID=A0A9W9TXI2_9EURO|nr:uncharacterized protein N7468_001920 [Penicillium chermesinum]KAJ5246937.1 hypothetical protein N7468_001920 [Penicillium chermesinum]KAJ6145190.1 hypothetical protein N7470_009085 [Penicillium chermesinum]